MPTRTPTRTRTATPVRRYFPQALRQPTDRPTATPRPEFNCRNYLSDGDFERGTEGWFEFPTAGEPIIRTDRPHQGKIGAWFAGFDNAHDWISSDDRFIFPRKDGGLSGDLVSGRIGASVVVVSSEAARSEADVLSITLRGPGFDYDCEITSAFTRDQWTIGGGCLLPDELVAVASQRVVRVVVEANTDSRRPTGWAVDDVFLNLCTRW